MLFLGFWIGGEINTFTQSTISCTILIACMEDFFQKMDSKSVANPTIYNNVSIKLKKLGAWVNRWLAQEDAEHRDRINMKL